MRVLHPRERGGRGAGVPPLGQASCPGLRLLSALPSATRTAGLVHNSGTSERSQRMGTDKA